MNAVDEVVKTLGPDVVGCAVELETDDARLELAVTEEDRLTVFEVVNVGGSVKLVTVVKLVVVDVDCKADEELKPMARWTIFDGSSYRVPLGKTTPKLSEKKLRP